MGQGLKESLKYRHFLFGRIPVGDVAQLQIELEDDVPEDGIIGACTANKTDVLIFAAEVFICEIHRSLQHIAFGGQQTVVALIPCQRRIDRAGKTATKDGTKIPLF